MANKKQIKAVNPAALERNKESGAPTGESWSLDLDRNWDKIIEKYPEFLQHLGEGENKRPNDAEIDHYLDDKKNEELRKEFIQAVKEMPGPYIARAMKAAIDEAYGPPTKAPILWENRKPKQKLFDFIRDVYGPWIGKGLKRSDFSHLDPRLYNTLAVRLKRNPDCLPKDLVSLEDKDDAYTKESLQELGIFEPKDAFRIFPDDRKEANRAYSAATRHLKR